MSECHKCRVARDIEAGRYRNVDFVDTPCAQCRLSGELTHKGRSHVSRDSSDAVSATEAIEADRRDEYEQLDGRLEAFAGFLNQFMALPPVTRDIVARRFTHPNRPLNQVARQYGITVQAAHSRLKRALDRWPVLRTVIEMRTYRRDHDGDD